MCRKLLSVGSILGYEDGERILKCQKVNLVDLILVKGFLKDLSSPPSFFITYHADMGDSLGCCLSHFFANDLAAIVAGSIDMKFFSQYLDLEKN